jgi:hypothetical protein
VADCLMEPSGSGHWSFASILLCTLRSTPEPLMVGNAAGRPPKYDWEEIVNEACAFVYRNDSRATYSSVVDHIMNWHQIKYGRIPAKSTLHDKVENSQSPERGEKINSLTDRCRRQDFKNWRADITGHF